MSDWLTLREAAAASGMSSTLALLLCRAGIVRARVVRGRWWVHAESFTPWTGEL